MLVRWGAAATILLAFSLSVTAQSGIDHRTPCSVAAHAFDTEDLPAVREVRLFIQNIFGQLDKAHTDNGEPGIMAQLNDHGVGHLVASAISFCRQHPKATIFNEAANVYRGMRAIEIQFGTAR